MNTLIKLADALKVEVRDLITFPEENERDRVMELLRVATPDLRITQLRMTTMIDTAESNDSWYLLRPFANVLRSPTVRPISEPFSRPS